MEIHADQLKRYGGRPGIREPDLLRSAVAMPAAGTSEGYFHANLYEMAGAYLFHLVQNHPFVDGNKRVGAVAAYVFLRLNGLELTADESDYENLVRKVSKGQAGKEVIAKFFRENTKASS